MLVSPLEHKLDKILRATEKTLKQQPQRPLVRHIKRRKLPKTPKKQPIKPEQVSTSTKSGWISSMKRGALKGLGNSMGVSLDNDEEGADTSEAPEKKRKKTPRAVKRLRAAPGWEDFMEGRKLRRQLLPEYDDTDDEET